MGRDTVGKYGTFWHTIKVLLYIRGWWGVGMPGCRAPGRVDHIVGMLPDGGWLETPSRGPKHAEIGGNHMLNHGVASVVFVLVSVGGRHLVPNVMTRYFLSLLGWMLGVFVEPSCTIDCGNLSVDRVPRCRGLYCGRAWRFVRGLRARERRGVRSCPVSIVPLHYVAGSIGWLVCSLVLGVRVVVRSRVWCFGACPECCSRRLYAATFVGFVLVSVVVRNLVPFKLPRCILRRWLDRLVCSLVLGVRVVVRSRVGASVRALSALLDVRML